MLKFSELHSLVLWLLSCCIVHPVPKDTLILCLKSTHQMLSDISGCFHHLGSFQQGKTRNCRNQSRPCIESHRNFRLPMSAHWFLVGFAKTIFISFLMSRWRRSVDLNWYRWPSTFWIFHEIWWTHFLLKSHGLSNSRPFFVIYGLCLGLPGFGVGSKSWVHEKIWGETHHFHERKWLA